jgi:hypothetical protein
LELKIHHKINKLGYVGAYLILWMCGLTQNLNGFKISFEKLLQNKIEKKGERAHLHSQPSLAQRHPVA